MKFSASLLLVSASVVCAQQFSTGQAARLVIGQDTFTRQESGASERHLGAVSGIALSGDTLFVVDSSRVAASPQNNRVLIFRDISKQLPSATQSIPWHGDVRCPACGGYASNVLGQKDFTTNSIGVGADKFRNPTAVATDGRVLVVADTDNNRVLIWRNMPTSDAQAADVVVGQPDFNAVSLNYGGAGSTPSAKGLRGPQGVWIQDGRLYIADTQNNRVLIYNSIPTQNGASADVVLGAPNFTTFVQSDLVQATLKATASNMLNPVSVTSDGTRLYVADLGHNRVLIWNAIPTQNATPVDVVVGQPDVNSNDDNQAFLANNSSRLCASNGTDPNNNDAPTYPALCAATLNFPRYALSDGKRLFIADGGNDRVLVFNEIPNANGKAADAVLGQLTDQLAQDSDPLKISASDTVRTPMSLAWDGANLYVSDPFNRRITVWTPGDQVLPATGVRNAASRDIFAVAALTFATDPKENDEVTVKIGEKEYKYKAVKDDTIENVIRGLVGAINADAGDPQVFASPNILFNQLLLTSRIGGEAGNQVAFTMTFSDGAQLTGDPASGNLTGGQDAAKIAPGSLVTIIGDNLADETASAPDNVVDLPQTLGGVEVYFDGIRAPLLFVSPTEIHSQMPWEVNDSSSVSAYIRKVGKDGTVKITTAIGVPIIPQNPGIFAAEGGSDPRPARVAHGSSVATGVVSVDGAIKEGDIATVSVEDRSYSYTVVKDDTLENIRNKLIEQINQDEKVTASPATVFTRIILRARIPGPEGEGIAYGGKANDGASIIITPLSPTLCCASREGDPVTEDNPARPGEIITVYATGLGIVQPDEAKFNQVTGSIYRGPAENQPNAPLDAIAGGKTANVLEAGLIPGQVGLYAVKLQLNSDIPTNPLTQLTIAQDIYISNIVTFAVQNPNPPAPAQ